MDISFEVEMNRSMEVNPQGETLEIVVDLKQIWDRISHYHYLYLKMTLQVPSLNSGEIQQHMSYTEINRSYPLNTITGKKIEITMDYFAEVDYTRPAVGRAKVIGYNLQEN